MSGNQVTFSIPSGEGPSSPPLKIRLHQATAADEDQGQSETNTGFVIWPSSVLLAHHLLKNPHIWRGDDTCNGDVMEMGAGCGLAGLTVATLLRGGDSASDDRVAFTDYNPAVLENLRRNILLNEFETDHDVFGLDWFDQCPSDGEEKSLEKGVVDMEGKAQGQFRLIIGADLLVCSNDADLVAATIDCALAEGGQAIILGPSSDARFGVGEFPEACRSLGLSVEVDENIFELGDDTGEIDAGQRLLLDALELGGHGQRSCTRGHDFTLFTIDKPMTSA